MLRRIVEFLHDDFDVKVVTARSQAQGQIKIGRSINRSIASVWNIKLRAVTSNRLISPVFQRR